MKLKVKTLKGTSFEIEAEPKSSVAEVKRILEDTLGRNEYPVDQLALIYQGKFLKNDTTLESNKVSEGSFIVAVLSMPEASPSGVSRFAKTTAPIASTRSAAFATPVTSLAETVLSQEPVAISQLQAASNLVSDNELEQAIQQILDMRGGIWERNTVVRALNAANYDIGRAADYMYLGIPGSVASSLYGRPNTCSINLFPQDVPSSGANPSVATSAGAGVIESYVQQHPQFKAILDLCRVNPQVMKPLFKAMKKECPELLQSLTENQDEFLRLLCSP